MLNKIKKNRIKILLILSNIVFVVALIILLDRGNYPSKIWSAWQSNKTRIDIDFCLNCPDTVKYPDQNYRWVKVNCNTEFAPRDGAGALVYKDSLWLLGGWNPDNKDRFPSICNNAVWKSKNGKSWTLAKENTFFDTSFDVKKDWEGRHTAGYVVFKDKMWIIGGDANQGHYQYDVWNSENGKSWDLITDSVPWGPRVLHYTVVFKDKIWIMGGQTLPQFANAEELFYSDIYNSEDGINWTKVETNNNKWLPRGLIGGRAVFKDRIWIIGGGTYDTPNRSTRILYSDVWSSIDGINWECHTPYAKWEAREFHNVAVYDNKLWLLEGASDGQIRGKKNRNDVWYSEDGETWIELPNTPWEPRHASSIFVKDNAMYIVGGNNMQSDVWKLEKIII
jgi:hypothetical protein